MVTYTRLTVHGRRLLTMLARPDFGAGSCKGRSVLSAIASLTLVSRSSVPELTRLACTSSSSLRTSLTEHGRKPQEEYDWSGYCLLHILTYLEERGVDLEQSEFDAESAAINRVHDLTVLITPARKAFLNQLDPAGTARKNCPLTSRRWGLISRTPG